MPDKKTETPVLIVGGGPTGLLASILLSKHEIAHVLVERRAETQKAPAAHVISARTMEIYRQAGLDVQALYALNTHPSARIVSWNSRLQRSPIGVFDMASNKEALPAQSLFSAQHTTNISQHRLEDHLKSCAERSAFADIRFGTEWSQFTAGDYRHSELIDGSGSTSQIMHQYLLAADGAGSPVARALEIKKIGPDSIATFLNLTCEVDLSAVAGEDDGLLYWLLDPAVQGTMIVHDPKRLAVYMRPLAVPYESADDYDDRRCNAILDDLFDAHPYELRHKGIWKMTAQVAESFRSGPVFLVGDSAHRFPPTGGLGLNTGAGDVHNVVWKIAAVLRGRLSDVDARALLDSYEQERRPVAQRNCDVSKRNNENMLDVLRALGLDPEKAGMLARVMNSRLVEALPATLRAFVLRLITQPVRGRLAKAEDPDRGAEIRQRVAAAIEDQREHFSSVGLDLGYVYRDGCAVADGAVATTASQVSTYAETVGVGARLPDRDLCGAATSGRLHDLIDYTDFALLTSGMNSSDLPGTFGMPVRSVEIADREAWSSMGLRDGDWVLVRPDGHVMARSTPAAS